MSKELVISANRHETKVAILEDDQLVEIYFQRAHEYSLAGSIHKGRVTRVLPGMQSAFVDLGLERDTFLYVSDFFEDNEEYDRISEPRAREERPSRPERSERPAKLAPEPVAVIEAAPVEAETIEPEVEIVPEVIETAPVVTVPVPVAVVASAPVAAATPPAERREERRDDRGGRDDRGRRGRRRRNRGRGFPESKYASSETGESPKPNGVVEREPEAAPDYDFPVLPGESLAKYRRPEHGTAAAASPEQHPHEETELAEEAAQESHAEQQEAQAPVEAHAHPEHSPEAAPVEAAPSAAPVIVEPLAAEPSAREETHWQRDEPQEDEAPDEFFHSSSGAAVAREPQSSEEFQPVIEPGHLTGQAAAETEAVDESEAESSEEAEAVSEIIAEAREGGAFYLEDIADSPQPAIELIESGGVESIGIAAGDEAEMESGDELETEAPVEAEPSSGGNVREQGGRYAQRSTRRMRRKMRGGAAAPEPAHAPRTERAEERRGAARPERSVAPSITELLKEGQEIIVQIAKEPLGQKGARITSHIALPGRYVVYMPTLEHMGVSRKIASDDERLRLKKILQAHRAGVQGGYIVRTAGEGKTEEEIAADMKFLANLWLDIKHKAEKKPAPLLLHHDLDIVQRILRDQVTDGFKAIWVDNEESYESILRFVQRFQPAMVTRVKLYTRSAPIFDAFNITMELEKALRPKVWLKSGGYIVINQTEALVAIDVNTGKYVGKSNRLEDTIVKTNTEAVKEIVRQIRLRDLGGIIVVDFIDMDERKNRQKVMQALEECMRADKAPYKILQFNDFGLVAITRKRVKQSLERALCSPCPYCEGAGSVKSVQTTVGDILQEAHKITRAVEGENVILRVNPEVAKFLKSNENKYLEELEEILRRPVLVKGDPMLHQEKFDLA